MSTKGELPKKQDELNLGGSVPNSKAGKPSQIKSRRSNGNGKSLAGAGLQTLAKATKRHPDDPKAQAAYFADNQPLTAATGRRREVSNKTQTDFYDTLIRGTVELRAEGMPIRNLNELGQAHIICLMRRWIAAGQAAATITTKLSFFRKFLTLIGKPQVIPRGAAWFELLASKGIDGDYLVRSQVASVSKSWESHGIDVHKVVARVQKECPITALHMELQAAFGLRVMESLQIEPEISDMGTQLHVFRGTKGGKSRMVQFDSDPVVCEWQRDVLERAKVVARKHPKRRLALPKQSLESARNHYYQVIKTTGVTKAELGVTSHGLRHSFAARKYEQMTESRPPVESPANLLGVGVDRDTDHHARLDISQELGHWRKDVTSAYLGSMDRMSRDAKRRVHGWLDVFEHNSDVRKAFSETGVTKAWLSGKAAMGMPLISGEKLTLIVQLQMDQGLSGRVTNLSQRLNLLIARGVSLAVHVGDGEPDGALALMVKSPKQRDGELPI